ncbi:MAG: DUF167 domain-containing protein [Gammaproteobacteria bacterium]
MFIQVQVKTRCTRVGVEELDDAMYVVRVNTPPVDGAANKKVIELLAKHFKTAKSNLTLVKGHKSKLKTIEVKIEAKELAAGDKGEKGLSGH